MGLKHANVLETYYSVCSYLLSIFWIVVLWIILYRCGNTWRFNSSFYQLWLRNLILDRASGHNVLSAKRECLHGGSCSNYSRRMASRKPNVWWEKRYVLNHTGSPAYPCHSLVRVLWNATFPPTLEILAIACHSLSQVPLARWKNNTNQTQNNKVLKLWARLVNMKTDVHCDICTSYANGYWVWTLSRSSWIWERMPLVPHAGFPESWVTWAPQQPW